MMSDSLFNEYGIWQTLDHTLLDVRRLPEAVAYLAKNKPLITHIGVSSENDFKKTYQVDFELIRNNFKNIKNLWVHCVLSEDTDISPLYGFERLEVLLWGEQKVPISLGKFSQLREFSFEAKKHKVDFSGSGLFSLEVLGGSDLNFLTRVPKLQKLTLRGYNGEDLKGIEHLKYLEDITIRGAKKLNNLKNITQCHQLKVFCLEYVAKNLNLSWLSSTNIEYLYIYNAVGTCAFVEKMQRLEYLMIKEVLDNDLTLIFNNNTLKEVYLLVHKKSYSHSKAELLQRFGSI